jgi:hypothetical protein
VTTEERFERIEHLTAGIAEERRKDREESKALWRDTQRQLNEVSSRLVQLSEADEEARAADKRLETRIEQLAEEGRATDKRIDAIVSAIGELAPDPEAAVRKARGRNRKKAPRFQPPTPNSPRSRAQPTSNRKNALPPPRSANSSPNSRDKGCPGTSPSRVPRLDPNFASTLSTT